MLAGLGRRQWLVLLPLQIAFIWKDQPLIVSPGTSSSTGAPRVTAQLIVDVFPQSPGSDCLVSSESLCNSKHYEEINFLEAQVRNSGDGSAAVTHKVMQSLEEALLFREKFACIDQLVSLCVAILHAF